MVNCKFLTLQLMEKLSLFHFS